MCTPALFLTSGRGTLVGQPPRETNGDSEAAVRAGARLEPDPSLSTDVSVWEEDLVVANFGGQGRPNTTTISVFENGVERKMRDRGTYPKDQQQEDIVRP